MKHIGFQVHDEMFLALASSNVIRIYHGDISKASRAIFKMYLEQVEGYVLPDFEPMQCGRPRKIKIKKRDK